ncbi:type IX secretion system sortase PorU [Flavobacterium sp. MK4S-17]|uniref:type IX secretion system sortase PorU n=1 Tax=Flavobacterium sp. MK4S-17 TaxID=2543737 RepID=UPI00135C59E8|nr:type IX secretion system sortase PorU [Flavobacterium sp. MK4S-17]
MKNKLLILLLLLVPATLLAQQNGTIVLNWKDNVKTTIGNVTYNVPQFQPEFMELDFYQKTISFAASIPFNTAVEENSLVITDAVYETITAAQLGDLSPSKIPADLNAKLHNKKAREQYFAIVTLSPIIKEGSGYKRLKSFSYSFSGAPAIALRGGMGTQGITNSVLATGSWYRFYVEKSGVYKISKSFLQQLGFNTNVDPRTIKVYGNGGRMAPLLNNTDYPMDNAENAVVFVGEEDGEFNNSDYILFYAEGVDNWNQESGTHNNLYADRSYYYVTSSGGQGKRMQAMPQPSQPADIAITAFDEYQYHERDLVSIARLGRKWHGEQFNVTNEQSFDFTIPDIVSGSPVSVTVSAAANSPSETSLAVKANNEDLGVMNFSATPDDNYGVDRKLTGSFTPAGGAIKVTLTYSNGGVPGSNAWLDYIIVRAKRNLRGNGKQFRFRYNDAASNVGVAEYQVANAGGISQIWDITDIYNATKVENTTGQSQFSFKAQLGEVRQYIAVAPSDYYTPQYESKTRVANQNLKGTIFNNQQGQFQDIDYIIITPKFLHSPAEKLANFHRTKSGLNVKVVNLENIYEEFSSGKQDIAGIRNFVKYVYFNASSPDKRIKYLNLFGDASFDYKDRIPNNTNIVPSLHAYEENGANYSTVTTFVSDDFFVLMDPGEGNLRFNTFQGADIAVGRMLVSSVRQANEMVQKVFDYVSEESYGRWRNEFIVITDDLEDSGSEFIPTLENAAATINAQRPFVNIRKIHADAYVQETSAGGNRYPEVKEQIVRTINYGALVVNYLGHGGEDGMASERIFEKSDVQRLTNKYKYPLFITATCELTKFDNPYRPTVGEDLYWSTTGGAIAMITTTRSIFISSAFDITKDLPEKLYAFGLSEYPTMAEALRLSKVAIASGSLSLVAFVGDPALKLAVPRPKIELTEINDVPVAESTDILKSLSYVKLAGRVTDEAGNPLNTYNGELAVTVFDKEIQRTTLGNDGIKNSAGALILHNFNTLGETIFRGNASVVNGNFEFGFVVPRDIKIPVGEGRISFYAKRDNILEDQTGYDATIKIGGVNENAAADNTPPRVRLYMNDETFISGGITNDSPFFLAFLEDENGINTASGIGHDMIAILDGDETNPYLLNDYYESEKDNYTRGSLRFPFTDLEKGLHTITFKAWDVYNNLVTAEIQFVVTGDDVMKLEKVLNYPNPFVSYTEFWFTHNKPYEPLDVQVQIFTVSGKVVKTINQSVTTEGFLCRDIKWDGKDDFGDRIGKGVYIYKLTVRSTVTNKRAEKYEKLVLL